VESRFEMVIPGSKALLVGLEGKAGAQDGQDLS
jgi:hypothetical protein